MPQNEGRGRGFILSFLAGFLVVLNLRYGERVNLPFDFGKFDPMYAKIIAVGLVSLVLLTVGHGQILYENAWTWAWGMAGLGATAFWWAPVVLQMAQQNRTFIVKAIIAVELVAPYLAQLNSRAHDY
jgi:hypothetical protein